MSRRCSHALTWLALVATLLIVAMPTVGRQFGGGFLLPGESSAAIRGAMHSGTTPAASMDGMDAVDRMLLAEHTRYMCGDPWEDNAPAEDLPAPHEGHPGHDCAYCPLASGLVAYAVPRLDLRPAPLAPWSVRAAVSPPLPAPVPALGSRGPPILL